jgi:hypothetical protein
MAESELKLTLTEDEYDKIVRRERNYLGFGPEVAQMSDLEILRKGVARTRRIMRQTMKNGSAFVANGALIQFHDTQLAFNIARDAE